LAGLPSSQMLSIHAKLKKLAITLINSYQIWWTMTNLCYLK
jgi:hypothetical protein